MRNTKQDGQIVRSGRFWCLRYWQRRTEDGKLVRKRLRVRLGEVTTRSSKPPKEITDAAAERMAKVNSSTIAPEQIVTVGSFAEQVYLPWADAYKGPSTSRAYRQVWEAHLKSKCGSAWLSQVETHHVQKWLNAIASGSRTLSVSTLQHCKFSLSGLFWYALQQGYRTSPNPVIPCSIPPKAVRKGTTHAYSPEEVSVMLSAFEEPAATVIAVAAFTGLRIGEIEGLEWPDYHDGCIYVARSVWRGEVSLPKPVQSAAPVAVVAPLAEILSMHHARSGSPTSGPSSAPCWEHGTACRTFPIGTSCRLRIAARSVDCREECSTSKNRVTRF